MTNYVRLVLASTILAALAAGFVEYFFDNNLPEEMTRSVATIAGSLMGAYIGFLVGLVAAVATWTYKEMRH